MKRRGNEAAPAESQEPTPREKWAEILESCYVICSGVSCAKYGACMDYDDEDCAAKKAGETPLTWRTSS